jgi:signal peptidase II
MPYLKLNSSKPLIGFSVALDIFILDQLSKWLILEYVFRPKLQPDGLRYDLLQWIKSAPDRLPPVSVEILSFFNLTMVWNEGVSFGMFHGTEIWFLVGLALAISVLFSVWLTRATGWVQAVALSLVIGGAIGNVVDRLRFGAVADFFDFHVMGWHYPAFNVADCAIVVGIALLVFDGIVLEPKRNKGTATA